MVDEKGLQSTTEGVQSDSALEVEKVSVSFAGLRALADVSISVDWGELRAIIGPNGAGKTTLFNAISGVVPLASGRIRLFGEDVTQLAPHRRVALGMTRTFQISQLFPGLSVFENALLAAQALRKERYVFHRAAASNTVLVKRAHGILEQAGLVEDYRVDARDLSHGAQRRLELALAAATSPRLLLLDEPSAGLGTEEAEEVISQLADLTAGMTVVIIEHDIDLVLRFADRITVLDGGSVLAEGLPEEIQANPKVQRRYFEGAQGDEE